MQNIIKTLAHTNGSMDLIRLSFVLFLLLSIYVKGLGQVHQVKIKTSAICEMCKYTLEKEMALEKGVKSADLNLDSKVLTVSYNPKKTNPATIRKRISLTGYHADDVKRDSVAYSKLPFCCKDGGHD